MHLTFSVFLGIGCVRSNLKDDDWLSYRMLRRLRVTFQRYILLSLSWRSKYDTTVENYIVPSKPHNKSIFPGENWTNALKILRSLRYEGTAYIFFIYFQNKKNNNMVVEQTFMTWGRKITAFYITPHFAVTLSYMELQKSTDRFAR